MSSRIGTNTFLTYDPQGAAAAVVTQAGKIKLVGLQLGMDELLVGVQDESI